MNSSKYLPIFILCSILIAFNQCARKPVTIKPSDDKIKTEEDPLFSEKFRKIGWINSSRYRAVIHILTYDKCMNSDPEIIKEDIELRAFRTIQHELQATGSRDAAIQIRNLIKNNGVILRPDLTCRDINIYYFDIVKNNLTVDFKNIQSLK